jgi:tetratricopeptide (TPR) repeat protein
MGRPKADPSIPVRLKPDTTYTPLGAAFWRTAPFLLGLAIVLLPVAIRNYAVGGGFYLTTSQFGPNFYMGNNEKADGTAMSLRRGRGSPEYERQDAIDLAERARGRTLTPAEVSSYWTEQSLAFMTSHPVAWMKLQGRKAVLLWNATEILDTESQESYAEWSTPLRIGGIFGHFGVLVPLALFGLLVSWNDRRRLWPLLAMIVAYAASVVMFYIYARYRYPLVPMLLLFAAAGITKLPSFVRSFRRGPEEGAVAEAPAKTAAMSVRGRVMVTVTVVLAVVFTNWPIVSADMNRTVTEHNLGAALQDEGRLDEAIAAYRRALVISPDYAPAYGNIGTAQQAKGQMDEAIRSYERALELSPDFPEIHYNLANALLAKNQPEQATEHFRLAAQALPGAADVHNNLGSALVEQGKFDEAVSEFQKAAQFDPKSAKVQRNLGNALASAGRPVEGLEHLLEATQLDPRDTSAHYDFGSLLLEGDLLPEAIREFRAAIALKPDMAEAHNNLGIALGLSGQVDASIAAFKEALRLNPNLEDARKNLAMTLEARDEALKKR